MGIYKVRNLQEGSRPGNWIRYWEDASGLPAGNCHRTDCPNNPTKATDGAHVQLVDYASQKWYIVPLCHDCNCKRGAIFYVRGPLVSVTDPKDILW